MTTLTTVSLLVAFHAVLLFLIGIPPFDSIAAHFFYKYHPIARQLRVVKLVSSLTTAEAVGTACTLGIFDLLKNEPLTAREIAMKLDLPERGVEPLLQTLAASDYLYQLGRTYSNSATAQHHLVSDLPDDKDMSGLVGLLTSFRGLGHMTESVRQGGTVLEDHAEVPENPWWEAFARYTGSVMSNAAHDVTKLMHHHPERVLDIASGSGAYGFAVVKRFPNAHVTLNDYANVLEITKQNAIQRSIDLNRLDWVPGSFFQVDLPTEYFDVVLAPNIIHHFSPSTTLSFLQKAYTLLRPGGHLIIVEFCRSDEPYSLWEGTAPVTRTFSLTMLLWTKEGKAYSKEEMLDLMSQSGFIETKFAGKSYPFACFMMGQRPKKTIK